MYNLINCAEGECNNVMTNWMGAIELGATEKTLVGRMQTTMTQSWHVSFRLIIIERNTSIQKWMR